MTIYRTENSVVLGMASALAGVVSAPPVLRSWGNGVTAHVSGWRASSLEERQAKRKAQKAARRKNRR